MVLALGAAACDRKPKEQSLDALFDAAEACADRYHCPPLDELADRAERPGETRVLEAAFDIMCDPKVHTFERRFTMAFATARSWAAARTTGGAKLGADDERVLRTQVMRLLGRTDDVVPAHSFIEYLPDARELFEREALDPRRGNDEVRSAIRGLVDREHDLTTVGAWLSSKDARPMIAGALLLDALNHDGIAVADEVALLQVFVGRHDTDPEAARIVAAHAAAHDQPAFAPVVCVELVKPETILEAQRARLWSAASPRLRAKVTTAASQLLIRVDAKPKPGEGPLEVNAEARAATSSVLGELGGPDLEAVALLVVMEAAKSAQDELKSAMGQTRAIDAVKGCKRDVRCAHALVPQDGTTRAQLDAAIARMSDDKDSLGELAKEQQLRTQVGMGRVSKLAPTLSDRKKEITDTQSSILSNLK